MAKRRARKHLLEGRSVQTLAQVAALTRIRTEDIAALAESNSLDGLILNGNRTAWAFFEDEVPTREERLRLGARSLSESNPAPVDDLPQGEGTVSWEMRW